MPPPFFHGVALKVDLRMILMSAGTRESYSRHPQMPPHEHCGALHPSMRTRAHRAVGQKTPYVGAQFSSRCIAVFRLALNCLDDDSVQISLYPAPGRRRNDGLGGQGCILGEHGANELAGRVRGEWMPIR